MRKATVKRKTNETDIALTLNLDGSGQYSIDTGVGFLNHMLELFAKHGCFDLTVVCRGDVGVDAHHTTEDIGICLGRAFAEAAGEKRGICRYGEMLLPMDEALVQCAVDFSGRSCLNFAVKMPQARVGSFDTELVEEFMAAFCRSAGINLHLLLLAGRNTHHIIEACYKALGRSLRKALSVDSTAPDALPSTKGVLE